MPQFQYKQQQFQQDAVNAVAGMFRGVDIGRFQHLPEFQLTDKRTSVVEKGNRPPPFDFIKRTFADTLEENLRTIKERNNIRSTNLSWDGDYLVLDTQMETGTGKTFTFINAIFELNKQYLSLIHI